MREQAVSLKTRTARLEKNVSRWYGRYLTTLTDEEFNAGFVRAMFSEQAGFTMADMEHLFAQISPGEKGWRPLIDEMLQVCEVVGGSGKQTRYRYARKTDGKARGAR